jgi:hypothetical protein
MSELLPSFLLAVAQASPRGYTPFVDPLDLHDYWWFTIMPLAFGISLAYKSVRLHDLSRVWPQTFLMTAQVVAGMIGLAVAAFLIVEVIVYGGW